MSQPNPVDRLAGAVANAVRDSVRESLNRGLPQSAQAGPSGVPTLSTPGSAHRRTHFQRAVALAESRPINATQIPSTSHAPTPPVPRFSPSASCAQDLDPPPKRFRAPSMFVSKRRRRVECSQPKPAVYLRDIFCLPNEMKNEEGHVTIPRGSHRSCLAHCGLLGKIELMSDMSADEVVSEICRVFAGPFGLSAEDFEQNRGFPFHYLQRTGAGARTLCVPAVSSSFEWNGRQVATLGKSGGFIYILADAEIPGWTAFKKVN